MRKFPNFPGYKVEKILGEGGMATVYLGLHKKLNRKVAIKVIEPLLLKDPSFSKRFVKEAKTVINLIHPNIVSIYDIGESKNSYYLVMEYLGENLMDRINRGVFLKTPNYSLYIVNEIASALRYADEKGFIHRDIKPDNIMFKKNGTPVLVDFGIARAISSTTKLTKTGMSIGTPHYMSPEQIRGHELDGKSDIYSLGIVFYEMLTGKVPFDAEDTIAVAVKHCQEPIPQLPAQLSQFQPMLDKMIAKDPGKRFSASELLDFIKFHLEPRLLNLNEVGNKDISRLPQNNRKLKNKHNSINEHGQIIKNKQTDKPGRVKKTKEQVIKGELYFIFSILLIITGFLFLADNLGVNFWKVVVKIWPVIIILLGLKYIIISFKRRE